MIRIHGLLLLGSLLLLPCVSQAKSVEGEVVASPGGKLRLFNVTYDGVRLGPLTLVDPPSHLVSLARLGTYSATLEGSYSAGQFHVTRAISPLPFAEHMVQFGGGQAAEGESAGEVKGPAGLTLLARHLLATSATTTEVIEGTWVKCGGVSYLVVTGVQARLKPSARLYSKTSPRGVAPSEENMVVWLRSGPSSPSRTTLAVTGEVYRVDGTGNTWVEEDDLVEPGKGGLCDCLPR